jgi:hypothetical protein
MNASSDDAVLAVIVMVIGLLVADLGGLVGEG